MVWVGGVVGVIGHKGGALENRINAVIKETPTELPLTMWGQSQKVPATNQDEDTQPKRDQGQYLDLGLPSLQSCEQ